MSLYGALKNSFRSVIPESRRQKLWQSDSLLSIGLSTLKGKLEKTANNDDIYDAQYFIKIEALMKIAAPIIAQSVIKEFQPNSVIDVGCGTGDLLVELSKYGIKTMGMEYAQAALDICKSKRLDVINFNIEVTEKVNCKADVVISTEVAEHLPASCADKYVDLLTSISNTVMITAAPPGQGGTDHVNEQPNEYWIAKFEDRGFDYQTELTMKLRNEWEQQNIEYWYYSNVMVFIKAK